MKQGWESKKLGSLCTIKTGRKDVNSGNPDGMYPFFTCARSHTYSDEYSFDTEALLIAGNGDVGSVSYFKGKFEAYQRTYVLSDFTDVSTRYLFMYLNGFLKDTVSKQKLGNTMPYIKLGMLKEFPVPIASPSEQERIVAILDRCFEAIDKAKANVERNLQNAKDLFQSRFNDFFSKRDNSWVKVTLLELLEREWITSHLDGNHGGNYPRKSEFVESGVPYISANCLKDGYVDFSKAKFLSKERAQLLRKGIAVNNDVLFAHNATVGPTALLKTDEMKIILSTSLTYYRCDPSFINPSYLLLYLRSKEFIRQYESVMRQSTRNQVPITKQRTFYHLIPPIAVQNEIVPQLNRLNQQLETLNECYSKQIVQLDELKKSILQKAFNGELTETEEAA